MLVTEAVRVLKEVDATLGLILSRMQEIAKTLPEYSVVREMGGVGNTLAPKLIAEIGDVRRFRNGRHWLHSQELIHHRMNLANL